MTTLHDLFLVEDVPAMRLTCRCCGERHVLPFPTKLRVDWYARDHRCRRAA